MFDKVCLYTTAKCRSMTTKTEFVDMWNKVTDNEKKIICNNITLFVNDYELHIDSIDLYMCARRVARITYKLVYTIE